MSFKEHARTMSFATETPFQYQNMEIMHEQFSLN